jgi:glycosyltransferase involved in cell wall biosynthesis
MFSKKEYTLSILNYSLLINLAVLFDKPTGIATYALNLIDSLSSLNPILLTAQKFPDRTCYSIPDNLTPAQGSRGHLRRLMWTQWQLPQIYRQLRGNLIYSPLPEAPLYSNCRHVVMCHDLIPLRFPRRFSPLTNYFRFVVPSVLSQSQHIICNSAATAKDLVDFYGIDAAKITPILLAYDRTNFYPRSTLPKTERPYFLYLGRHDPYKNLQGLIAAFAAIPNNRDYQLWIAGSTDPRFTPQLQQQTVELGISDRVLFLDYLTYQNLPFIISGAIALVFPTFWEGFGLPVLEAMACGTPVITSKLASLPEITDDAAILIDPYNISEITAAMLSLANDSQLRSRLSDLSKQQAQKFSWEKTGNATKRVLKQYF